jgi:Domain of unknown function (DUF1937)
VIEIQTYYYLSTPYSLYPGGLDAAFNLAIDARGLLVEAGIPVFSPIIHSHPVAMRCGLDPHDHALWLPVEEPIMWGASGLILLRAKSWEISYGMRVEREYFESVGKPIVWMDPGDVPVELLP